MVSFFLRKVTVKWEKQVFSVNGYKRYLYVKWWIKCLPHNNKKTSKRITELNLRAKTTKSLEENIEVNLWNFRLSNDFLDMTPKEINEKNLVNWTSSELKFFTFQK